MSQTSKCGLCALALVMALSGGPLSAQGDDPVTAGGAADGGGQVAADLLREAGLVDVAAALAEGGPVTIAGVVDSGAGDFGNGFDLLDASASRIPVIADAAAAAGLEDGSLVVVRGAVVDGVLHAAEILIPTADGAAGTAEQLDQPTDPNRGLRGVMIITMIVWIGLFLYVFWVDRKVARLEAS
jgi:CcmD family protein